jgi:hypothetical protein
VVSAGRGRNADPFPSSLTCIWSCAGAGGGTCTPSGSGNINDPVNLPSGGSVTYTAVCTVSPLAAGTISNTATVTAPAGVTDPNPANNSSTDSDAVADTIPAISPLALLLLTATLAAAGMAMSKRQ